MSNGHDPSEDRLVQAAKRHRADFGPLYERYADAVYGYCYRRVNDPEVAADLTSHIFIRALDGLPRFTGANFRAWLFTIARNTVIDHYRTDRRMNDIPDTLTSTDPSPETLALTNETRATFQDAMHHLTDQQREIVNLRLAGLTGNDIARITGLSLSAVKSTQVRAYSRLRSLMSSHAEPEAAHD